MYVYSYNQLIPVYNYLCFNTCSTGSYTFGNFFTHEHANPSQWLSSFHACHDMHPSSATSPCHTADKPQTHIVKDLVSLRNDGHLLPAELSDGGREGWDAGAVRGDGAEEVGKAACVREGDGGRCVADLMCMCVYMSITYYISNSPFGKQLAIIFTGFTPRLFSEPGSKALHQYQSDGLPSVW